MIPAGDKRGKGKEESLEALPKPLVSLRQSPPPSLVLFCRDLKPGEQQLASPGSMSTAWEEGSSFTTSQKGDTALEHGRSRLSPAGIASSRSHAPCSTTVPLHPDLLPFLPHGPGPQPHLTLFSQFFRASPSRNILSKFSRARQKSQACL